MTCEGISGFEYLPRPYPYAREPFRLEEGELVAYHGPFFSTPAFGLLADKRLFTEDSSHPVESTIKLYINKDAGLSQIIEPRPDASGYTSGTPHYADVILDMRDLLDEVVELHAADSDHTAKQFFASHMRRNRAPYDLDNSSASGVSDCDYVHPAPANTVPLAPSSTIQVTQQSSGIELGALQFQDIDLDEVMWQPFTRPKNFDTGPGTIPAEPIFPSVLPNGGLPSMSALDDEKFGEAGLGAVASGGILITGDNLLAGSTIKLLAGSGQAGFTEGAFKETIPWALYPSAGQLCSYYESQASGVTVSASGRQSLYDVPAGLADDTAYILDVSEAGNSGLVIQTWPGNYHSTSGVDSNDLAHRGVQTIDRLIYQLSDMSPGNPLVGRSILNGKKIFGHHVGTETSSKGFSVAGRFKYANGNSIYTYGGVTKAVVNFDSGSSRFEWGTTGNQLSPVNWSENITTALQPFRGIFGARDGVTYQVTDQVGSNIGSPWLRLYDRWGFIDTIVYPGGDRATGGDRAEETINYEIHTFGEGTDDEGNFKWIEFQDSPTFTTSQVIYFSNTYFTNNIFSFFFYDKPNNGMVNVGGTPYFQWSQTVGATNLTVKPEMDRFATFGNTSTKLFPEKAREVSVISIGYFPNWALVLTVTTNNQVVLPDKMNVSPSASKIISFAPGLSIQHGDVQTFGPPAYDATAGVTYIYFRTLDSVGGKYYFAKMDDDLEIFEFNEVNSGDVIFGGRAAVLSI